MKKIWAVLLAVVMVMVLVSCGEQQKGDAQTTKESEHQGNASGMYKPFVAVQGVSDTEIVVGNTAATTGGFAGVGVPFNAGMQAAFKEYNDAGGFHGKKIVFKHYDDGFDGAQGLVYTKQLVETDRIFALVGHFGTNTVGATLDYIKEKGIPMVYAATGIDELYHENAQGNEKVVYPVQPIFTTEGRVLLARAVANKENNLGLGGKKIGVIATTDDAGEGLLSGIKIQAQNQGIEIKVQQVEPSATDYAAAVNTLKNAGCDVVIAAMNQAPLANMMASMRDANYNANVITSYVNASPTTLGAFVQNGSVTAERMIYATGWLDVGTDEGKADFGKYAQAMAAWEMENGMSGSEYTLNAYAMAGYISGNIFVQGLQAVENKGFELNYENFVAVMEELEFKIPMGGSMNFRNGTRFGVSSFALVSISLEPNGGLLNVSPIMSLEELLKEK
ncbi:MAG: ABC transporter substrate-binding protein [Bacillota bacterium]|nr:ABC transporter substrate-binding protein [Bacillota bacterium]